MSLTPSGEQALILMARKIAPEMPLKVRAAAGAGKTSMLQMIAEAEEGPLLYLSYSAKLVEAAASSFPKNVDCLTVHSLAYRVMKMKEVHNRLNRPFTPDVVANLLSIERRDVTARQMGGWIQETVRKFCQGGEGCIEQSHLPTGLEETFAEDVLSGAQELWDMLVGKWDSNLPLEHDMYLKLWHLRGARLTRRYRGILMDECHDSNPVTLDAMMFQSIPITWVGDEPQSIFLFRRAINALRIIRAPEYFLTQSYRFGPPVAEIANKVVAHSPNPPPRPVVGYAAIESVINPSEPKHPISVVCRSNAGLIMEALASTGSLHVVGGVEQLVSLARGVEMLSNGHPAVNVPALSRFRTYDDMMEAIEDAKDPELRILSKLIDRYGDQLGEAVSSLEKRLVNSIEAAETSVMSAHRSKGLTVPGARLSDDFTGLSDLHDRVRSGRMTLEQYEQEINLMYVAVTRPRYELTLNDAATEMVATKPLPVSAYKPADSGSAAEDKGGPT
ncbi:MAG: hypothetical protein F8N36_13805 [Desulfovibrio sp.]|uniref:UvrD-helicase domain-containing protein n=1 Tax=Desulfovibrio sp. TaxID=885 RepID=UPI00135DA8AD|nr:UvrD-helicase domain-containing protein [Desulfovibrio sp.]MTJ93913.1 hypothetical protein [Desulfovibrio sp.]